MFKENREDVIKSLQEINYEISGDYTCQNEVKQLNSANNKIKLNETETTANLEINKNSLNTLQENELELKITLNENSEKYDLYKNPKIDIEMPEQVKDVEITSINKMYADNFSIKKYEVQNKNSKKIIHIEMIGEDIEYTKDIIGGPTLLLNIKINLDKTSTNSNEQVVMNYINENAKKYENDSINGTSIQNIDIVSPTGMITTNTIEALNIDTVGEEENQEVKIDIASEEKEIQVEKQIINNTGEDVENVVISGTFATDTKDNNMNVNVSKNIEVLGIDNAQIYYSNKENATTNLTDEENGWSQEISDTSEVKNYMVILSRMKAADTVSLSYSEVLPANLEYNQNAIETYGVSYLEASTNTNQEVNGTTITLSTGTGPDLSVALTAEVGGEEVANGSEVKVGEVIRYRIKVTNNGTEAATNVAIKGLIPEGAVYVEPTENYEYAGIKYYDEKPEIVEYSLENNTILAGETKIYTYEVRVKEDATLGAKGINKITVIYNLIEKESNEIINTISEGKVRVTVKRISDRGSILTSTTTIKLVTIVENTSEQEISNVKINLRNSENSELYKITTENLEDITSKENIIIDTIPANSFTIIYEWIKLKDNATTPICEVEFSSNVEYDNNIYRANQINITGYNYILNIEQTSEQERKEVKAGEEVEYKFTITNLSKVDLESMAFYDEIPLGLTVLEVKFNDNVIMKYDLDKAESNDNKAISRNISFEKNLSANSINVITIKTVVNGSNEKTKKEITNYGRVSRDGVVLDQSNEIKVIINYSDSTSTDIPTDPDQPINPDNPDMPTDPSKPTNPDDPNTPVEPSNPTNPDNSNTSTNPIGQTYSIGGIVWIDNNNNGKQDENEETLEGTSVKLYDLNSKSLVRNEEGEEIIVKTKKDGSYIFDNVKIGKYIVLFDYDNLLYKLTTYKANGVQESKNSDVFLKKLEINGTTKEYATTDTIDITDRGIYNINMGLIKIKKLNLMLQKSIDKVVVQNSKETVVQQYDSTDLAKVELNAKKINETVVVVEYNITVTNNGEADAYIKKIEDNMPRDMSFKSNLNTDWYYSGDKLYNTSLSNIKLKAGESKTLKLILTKEMTTSNTGLVNNVASISELYNEQSLIEQELNDNKDNAQLIISVKTGEFIKYSAIYVCIFVGILILGYIIINKKMNMKGGE